MRRDDARSDVYFMGCIFYHMLTGEPPLPETKDRTRRLAKSRFTQVAPIQQLDPTFPSAVALVVNRAMELDPEKRYQTPAAMLGDLTVLYQRLSGEGASDTDSETETDQEHGERPASQIAQAEQRRTVMVVESNAAMQDLLRKGLKKAGFRVLVLSNPRTALDRFRNEATTADCVIFNAQSIGRRALDVFNRFGDDRVIATVPAILLLEDNQRQWKAKAKTAEHRVVLPMPITMKQLRVALTQLIESESQPVKEPEPPAES